MLQVLLVLLAILLIFSEITLLTIRYGSFPRFQKPHKEIPIRPLDQKEASPTKHSLNSAANFLLYLLLASASSWLLKGYVLTNPEDPFRIIISLISALLLSLLPFKLIDFLTSKTTIRRTNVN